MSDLFTSTLPWYIAGPLIGLVVPFLLIFGGKVFGISANLRHMCAAVPAPKSLKPDFLQYDWKKAGTWNLFFILGVGIGGLLVFLLNGEPNAGAAISEATKSDLMALGVTDFSGLVPDDLIGWSHLASLSGFLMIVGGGFLVGFGARWAGGCTSGHAISGLSDLQFPSLVAVIGFFVGGLLMTHLLFPLLVG